MNATIGSSAGAYSPILDTIRWLHEMGFWLEIVTLVIPGFNDSNNELTRLVEFLASVSSDIPWHVTAFHKDYKMTDPRQITAGPFIPLMRSQSDFLVLDC